MVVWVCYKGFWNCWAGNDEQSCVCNTVLFSMNGRSIEGSSNNFYGLECRKTTLRRIDPWRKPSVLTGLRSSVNGRLEREVGLRPKATMVWTGQNIELEYSTRRRENPRCVDGPWKLFILIMQESIRLWMKSSVRDMGSRAQTWVDGKAQFW
jgi:hypothetical protein